MHTETNSYDLINALQKKWKRDQMLSLLLVALAFTVVIMALGYTFFSLSWWWTIPLFALLSLGLLTINQSWRVSKWDVSWFLNQNFPPLEESCELLLKPLNSLNFLQQLQRKKIEQILPALAHPIPVPTQLKSATIVAAIALLISFIITQMPFQSQQTHMDQHSGLSEDKPTTQKAEEIFPRLTAYAVKIIPPAYTGISSRTQHQPALKVEAGSRVQWQLSTNTTAEKVRLLFNEQDSLVLQADNPEHTLWSGQTTLYQSGFYQVKVENKLSELYQIEVIPDQPPVIHITSPEPHTIIDFGAPQQVEVKATLSDGYGVQQASIQATLARGSGENVSFEEKQLSFDTSPRGKKNYRLTKTLALPQLGMKPGDELYFYVKAVDNQQQESRSEVYFITLPDTAELMSLDGLTMGVNLVPEYFRSQRQIIIDTEKLIHEQDSISVQAFQNRSNNLGIDQKLLRLRYGKFLGEESETYSAGSHHHEENEPVEHQQESEDHAHDRETSETEVQGFGDARHLLESFGHAHDNAEDATFFDPELKGQLKATLTEMWNAELRLRTLKPQQALPFEYKALRLLKDLQQKSRAYVGKTAVKTPPLKPEKRLSGELDDITDPVYRYRAEQNTTSSLILKKALTVLESARYNNSFGQTDLRILRETGKQLNEKAAEQPGIYLKAANALRNILSTPQAIKAAEIAQVAQTLQKMINLEARLPQPATVSPSRNLSQQYFENLHQINP